MKMKSLIKVFAFMAVSLFIATPVLVHSAPKDKPADNMQILRDKIAADKKLVVSEDMQLTESEAKAFWPVYDAYQKDLGAINERVKAMIKSYADAYHSKKMTNQKAKALTNELLSIQAAEVKLMQDYVPKLSKVLPATKVVLYLQIENKIRAIIKYELAYEIPFIQ